MSVYFVVCGLATSAALWWVALRGLAGDVLGPLSRGGSRSWM
jgi:hypothetical protein